jgi:hypothetical protein
MKHQSVKRLMLKKQTVVHLNNGVMKRVKAGDEDVTHDCQVPSEGDTDTCICPVPTDDENTCVTCQVPIGG